MTRLENLQKGGVMDKPPTEKKCCDCGRVKPVGLFKKSHGYRDGRLKRCRDCERKRIASQQSEIDNGFFAHDKYYSF